MTVNRVLTINVKFSNYFFPSETPYSTNLQHYTGNGASDHGASAFYASLGSLLLGTWPDGLQISPQTPLFGALST